MVFGQKQSVKLQPVLSNVYGAPELIPRNEFRQPALQNKVHKYNSTPPSPPPPQPRTVCVYCTFSLGRGRGEEVKEKVEWQQYTSIVTIVPSSMGATVHKLGRKYKLRVNVSPVYVYKVC